MLDTSPRPTPLFSHVFLPTYKILIVGDCAVGKSNLLTRFTRNTFDIHTPSTLGVEFATRAVWVPTARVGETAPVLVQLWDTAGQERFDAISAAFFRNAVGAMVVYDVTRRVSLERVSRWVQHVRTHACAECVVMVLGNKTDLTRLCAVGLAEGEAAAHAVGARHFVASALSGNGVEEAFVQMVLAVDALQAVRREAEVRSGGQRVLGPSAAVGTVWSVPGGYKKRREGGRMDLRGFGAGNHLGTEGMGLVQKGEKKSGGGACGCS